MKQLIVFFTFAYAFSWLFWFPLYAPAFGFTNLPVIPLHHAFGAFGPLLASLICTRIFDGKAGLSRLLKRFFQIGPVLYFLIAAFAPFLLALLAMYIDYLASGTAIDFSQVLSNKEFPSYSFLALLLYNLVFFGYGEEAGWRGFALPRLQQMMHPVLAALLLGLLWAVWHWPLFFYRPGYTGMDAAGIAGWTASLLTGSVLLSWLYNGSRGSILVCAVFHSTIDIVFTGNSSPEFIGRLGMLVTFWGIAGLFLLWRQKGKSEKN